MNITMFLGSECRSERVYMRNKARKLSVPPTCRAIIAPAGLKELAMRDIVALRQFF
jgi:hypothetical protein